MYEEFSNTVKEFGDNLHPQILKRRDQKKNECLGGVKESLLYVSCQKRLCKLEYDFEG